MPRFTVNLSTDNDAFEPDPAPELARILRHIADKIEADTRRDYEWFQTILDENGNDVGRYALKPNDYR